MSVCNVFLKNFICWSIFGCPGSLLLCRLSSHWGARALGRSGFSSCGVRAWQPRLLLDQGWNWSPGLAGGLFSTESRGSPVLFFHVSQNCRRQSSSSSTPRIYTAHHSCVSARRAFFWCGICTATATPSKAPHAPLPDLTHLLWTRSRYVSAPSTATTQVTSEHDGLLLNPKVSAPPPSDLAHQKPQQSGHLLGSEHLLGF